MRTPIWVALVLLAAMALAACGEGATPTPQPTPTPVPQINRVSFSAFDFGFNGPESIPAGMTTFSFANEGQDLHHLQLVKLAEGMTAEDLLAGLQKGGAEGATTARG